MIHVGGFILMDQYIYLGISYCSQVESDAGWS